MNKSLTQSNDLVVASGLLNKQGRCEGKWELVVPPTLNYAKLGNGLQFSWNASFGNYKLQAQTNSLDVGLSGNWADYPGGGTSPVSVPMDATKGTVFFRLVSP